MTKTFSSFLFAVLLFSSVFLLFSCGGKETIKNGIDISDEKADFSKDTEEKSKAVFYSILEGGYIAGGIASVPPAKAEQLRDLADDIWKITVDYPISEAQYNDIISQVEKNKDSFVALFTDERPGLEVFKSVYHSLTSGGGADYAGHTLYNLFLFGMNYKYDTQMERYEKYGYLYLLEEAEEIERQKKLLESEIGLDNFSLATRIFTMGAELFFGGALEDEKIDSFSDREIALMLKRVEIASLDISDKGYEFLLGLAIPDSVDENSSASARIFYAAGENGDMQKISAATDKLKFLLASVQGNLTDGDALLMREGNFIQLLTNVFSRLEDAEWDAFSQITSIELNYGEYESVLAEIYGEDFEVYSSRFSESITLDELRDSVNSDSFKEKLEGYLAGISPALTYRIFK